MRSIRKKGPKSPEIVNLIKSGKKKGNSCLSVFVLKNSESDDARLFIATIAKRFVKKSTDRNLYKRRIKTVFSKNKDLFKGKDLLVMARSDIGTLKTYKELEENLTSLFDNFRKKEK